MRKRRDNAGDGNQRQKFDKQNVKLVRIPAEQQLKARVERGTKSDSVAEGISPGANQKEAYMAAAGCFAGRRVMRHFVAGHLYGELRDLHLGGMRPFGEIADFSQVGG